MRVVKFEIKKQMYYNFERKKYIHTTDVAKVLKRSTQRAICCRLGILFILESGPTLRQNCQASEFLCKKLMARIDPPMCHTQSEYLNQL
jgi:hypothetical protein